MNQFVHLHNHSEYSLLDGYGHVSDMVQRAADLGQPAMALTDHGNLYAAIDFFKAAKKREIKPIIGMEGYVAFGSRFDRSPNEGARGGSQPHLTMLSETTQGYRNLMELSTKAFIEGYYYRPRVDRELLASHSDGIIVLSGCLSGELARAILRNEGDLATAIQTAGWYKDVFGDRYYLELMQHEHVPGQDAVNRAVMDISQQLDIPTVVTNDCHYVHPHDAKHQDTLMCILTGNKLAQPNRLRMEDDSYYVKSADEMHQMFGEVPDALRNTLEIAERCNIEIGSDRVRLPKIEVPDGMTSEQYLRHVCYEGARERFGDLSDNIRQRLDSELQIIQETDFADYFLVVWDIFKFVKQAGILSTVRGSAASSLALYCLNVIDFNPLEYGLVFERFLNVERREMPDIDMEFADDRRKEVIGYCLEKYGSDRVAQIGTFGTMLTRSAIRDSARVMEDGQHDNSAVQAACSRLVKIANEMAQTQLQTDDDEAGPPELNLTSIRANSAEMRKLCDSDSIAAEIMERAIGVEGRIRNVGTHAAGVVISDEPLVTRAPLQRPSKTSELDVPSTQFAMYPLEQVGLLKWDFLGLKNLTVLDKCLKMIKDDTGRDIDIYEVSLNDPSTFDMMAQGDTFGSFQLEGAGMTRYIKELKPGSVLDVASMIALYRPGPMQHIDQFINAKHGRTPITYPHPSLEHILKETYGVIVYQDQVMLVAREFAGYTLGEADILRKAMGKKVPEIMQEVESVFVQGALKKGHTEEEAHQLFSYILPFAGYGFNKAHAVSYAYITYWTTYFKAHYPLHYWAAMLDGFSDAPNRMRNTLVAATAHGIKVLPPDVNASGPGFTIDHQTGPASGKTTGVIRYGLEAIKGVGTAVAHQICDARGDTPFTSVSDFCNRAAETSINEANLRPLILSGAFDSLASRTLLNDNMSKIAAHMRSIGAARSAGQTGLFGETGGDEMGLGIELGDASDNQLLEINQIRAWEDELFGIAITADPKEEQIRTHVLRMQESAVVWASSDKLQTEGSKVRCIGKVVKVERRYTRDGSLFLSIKLQMLDGDIDAVVWSNVYDRTEGVWHDGVYVDARATVRPFNNNTNLEISAAEAFIPLQLSDNDIAPAVHSNGTPHMPDSTATASNGHHRQTPNDTQADRANNGAAPATADGGNLTHGASTVQHSADNGNPNGDSQAANGDLPRVTLMFDGALNQDEQRQRLHMVLNALGNHAGNSPVTAHLRLPTQTVVMSMPFFNVDPTPDLQDQLTQILGEENVTFTNAE